MAVLYVAKSANLLEWASDVGLGKHVYKVGVADDPEAALAEGAAGETDWTVMKTQDAGDLTEAEALERLGHKEDLVNPNYYPRLRGATGIVKVKLANVENALFVAKMLENPSAKPTKAKAKDIADYLLRNAAR